MSLTVLPHWEQNMNLCTSCDCWYSLCYAIHLFSPCATRQGSRIHFWGSAHTQSRFFTPTNKQAVHWKMEGKGTWSLRWFLNHGAGEEGGFCILCIAEITYFVEIQGSVCKQKNQHTYLTRAATQNCLNEDRVPYYNTTRYPRNIEKQRNSRS